jgi:hypothetical protein
MEGVQNSKMKMAKSILVENFDMKTVIKITGITE